MGEAPPLDELAARKRLVQAKMELHRAEMALYYQQAIAPFQTVRSGFSTLVSHPIVRAVFMGGLGFLFVKGRLRFARKAVGWAAPLVFSRLRTFVMSHVWKWGLKGLQLALQRR